MYTAYDTPFYVESQTGTVDGLAQAELHYVKELTDSTFYIVVRGARFTKGGVAELV